MLALRLGAGATARATARARARTGAVALGLGLGLDRARVSWLAWPRLAWRSSAGARAGLGHVRPGQARLGWLSWVRLGQTGAVTGCGGAGSRADAVQYENNKIINGLTKQHKSDQQR